MEKKIIIDVLTLDSIQCAACGYVMETVTSLPPELQRLIEYREWSIKKPEGIQKFLELKGKVLPTICIDGVPRFEGVVPMGEELAAAILEKAQ